jgi:hypothetical protein
VGRWSAVLPCIWRSANRSGRAAGSLEHWRCDRYISNTFIMYSSWLDEPELCICTSGDNEPTVIPISAPSGGTPSDPVIILPTFLAIQGVVELRTLTGYVDNQYAYLEFNTSAGDGNGGGYVFDSADTTTDDSTDHIKPNDILDSTAGRWVRQNN